MTEELQKFVNTLPLEIQNAVQGKRNKGVLKVLHENDIVVPEYVLDVIEQRSAVNFTHDEILAHMRPFL